jgi:hypothetical protein
MGHVTVRHDGHGKKRIPRNFRVSFRDVWESTRKSSVRKGLLAQNLKNAGTEFQDLPSLIPQQQWDDLFESAFEALNSSYLEIFEM